MELSQLDCALLELLALGRLPLELLQCVVLSQQLELLASGLLRLELLQCVVLSQLDSALL